VFPCENPCVVTVEIETTLCVIRDDPWASWRRSPASGRWVPTVRARGTQTLEDVYYDTPSRILSSRAFAVRTRIVGDSAVFCIKQDEQVGTRPGRQSGRNRMPWSRQCMDHIAHILHKVAYGLVEVRAGRTIPWRALQCLGLSPIQSRGPCG
jgi:hypothetical protein